MADTLIIGGRTYTGVAGFKATDDNGVVQTFTKDGGGGGSGGLEYETGTYTPAEDINTPTISFANTHSVPPSFISISDVSGLGVDSNSNLFFSLIDTYRLTGSGWPYSASALRYGFLSYAYLGTSSATSSAIMMQHSSDETSDQSTTYYRYWATESGFKPSSNSTSRFWRAGRTYKWIAVWAPST